MKEGNEERGRGEKGRIRERSKHREGRQSKDGGGINDSFLITFQQEPYQPIFAFISPSLSPLWK